MTYFLLYLVGGLLTLLLSFRLERKENGILIHQTTFAFLLLLIFAIASWPAFLCYLLFGEDNYNLDICEILIKERKWFWEKD